MPIITDILNKEAPFLNSRKNRLLTIAFLGIFILLFLLIYNPFNLSNSGESIWVYVIVGVFIMLISQFGIRRLLGLKTLKIYQVILWAFAEIFLISLTIFFIYGPHEDNLANRIMEFFLTWRYSFLILVGPYFFIIWFLATRHQIAAFTDTPKEILAEKPPSELLSLTGERGKLILAVNYDSLIFIKSDGNYVRVHYLKGENQVHELIRMSMKELESKVDNPCIKRIHRSCLINTTKIDSYKKERKGYKLQMKHVPDETLNVSMGYMKSFEEAMGI